MGFPVPLHLWMRGRGGEFVLRHAAVADAAATRGLFDRGAVEHLIGRKTSHSAGDSGGCSTSSSGTANSSTTD